MKLEPVFFGWSLAISRYSIDPNRWRLKSVFSPSPGSFWKYLRNRWTNCYETCASIFCLKPSIYQYNIDPNRWRLKSVFSPLLGIILEISPEPVDQLLWNLYQYFLFEAKYLSMQYWPESMRVKIGLHPLSRIALLVALENHWTNCYEICTQIPVSIQVNIVLMNP